MPAAGGAWPSLGGGGGGGGGAEKAGGAAAVTLATLEQQVGVLKKLARKRPHNLFRFLQKHETFLPDFCNVFRELVVALDMRLLVQQG